MSKAIDVFHEDSDQPPAMLFLNGNIITEQDTLDAIDMVLESLNKTSDFAPVDATLKSLLGMQKLSGIALAKLLWGAKKWWTDHDMDIKTGDTFEDRLDAMHRMKKIVVERYITLWDKYETGMIPPQIRARNVKDQIAIATALEQGYDFNIKVENIDGSRKVSAWKLLEQATNNSEVLDIIRKVKGQQPRKSSLTIKEERDGTLNGWDNDGPHFLAALNVQDEDTDPAVHKGLERIRKACNSIRR